MRMWKALFFLGFSLSPGFCGIVKKSFTTRNFLQFIQVDRKCNKMQICSLEVCSVLLTTRKHVSDENLSGIYNVLRVK
jgi:hypothetical protein